MGTFYVSVDSLVGGAVLGATSLFLPGYSTAQRVVVPAAGCTVYVYSRGTTDMENCFEDPHGAGTPVAQPLTTDIDGAVVSAAGNRVYTLQPQELDVVVSGGGLSAPKTIPVGDVGEGGTPSLTKTEVVETGLGPTDIGADPAGAAPALAFILGG